LRPLISLNLSMKYWLSRFVLHILIIDKYDFQDVAAELKKLEIMKEDLEAELKRVTSIRTYSRAPYRTGRDLDLQVTLQSSCIF